MSDPLSITASIVAVLQLSTVAIQHLKDTRHGSVDKVRLRDELRHCVPLLEMLKDRIEDQGEHVPGEAGALNPASMASLITPDGPIAKFKGLLEDLVEKLNPKGKKTRLAQPLTWPFDKKDVLEMLGTMERLKSHFSLIMQNKMMYVRGARGRLMSSRHRLFHQHAAHQTFF